MQEFNEGDLVEAVKGETVIRGRVKYSKDVDTLYLASAERLVLGYLTDSLGYSLTVIEKAAPKLPTEMYTAILARLKGITQRRILFLYGEAWIDGDGVLHPASDITEFEIKAAPVPVTAKKVLDAIRQRIGSIDSAHDFQAVAATFGVTE